MGLIDPAYFLPTANLISSMVSPNKKWLAYYSYDWNGESASAQITVTNILADEEYATHLENLKLQPFDAQFRWANNTQIVLPLENEDELFHWLVWYPFEDRQEMISLELTGIGKDIERYDISPVYDPLLELVIYPCEQCGNTEYQVKNVKAGETLWIISGPCMSFR